jgi:sterol desaturase/sphingolipid hydroxylase (fatty acid hydroxylase superfamily)
MPALSRWASNLGLWATASATISLLLGLGPLTASIWSASTNFGLFHQLAISPLIAAVVTVPLLDLASYWEHRLLHQIGPLWRAHEVHHTDPDFDVTTGLRFHPLEAMLRLSFGMIVTALLGLPPAGIVLFGLTELAFTLVTHANVAVPAGLDGVVRTLFISPGMHRNHHAREMDMQQTNFGTVFSVWDRLFGTFSQPADVRQYGVEGLQDEDAVRFLYILREPFRKLEGAPQKQARTVHVS